MLFEYQKEHNLNQLQEEIYKAIPDLLPRDLGRGYPEPVILIEGRDDLIWITLLDENLAHVANDLDCVVEEHQPKPEEPVPEVPDREKIQEVIRWAKTMGFIPPWEE